MKRHLPPSHYSLKIRNYSWLAKIEVYESGAFESGGFKWKLIFYPNGDKKNNGENYISLYLAIVETETLHVGWEVNVNFKLFVYDHLEDKYLTIQDTNGTDVKRFHEMKTKWGFGQFMSLVTFKDPSIGYLVDDSCVFGAEVFVVTHTRSWESLSLVQPLPIGQKLSTIWEIENFTEVGKVVHESDKFTLGGKEWYLRIYPSGFGDNKGKAVSLFLMPSNWANNPTKAAVYAKYKLRILDRVHGKHTEYTAQYCFGTSRYLGYGSGSGNIISLKDLQNPENGFMVKARVAVEVEFLKEAFADALERRQKFCVFVDKTLQTLNSVGETCRCKSMDKGKVNPSVNNVV
ncbi:E3 ubiquitin-protein ligase SIN-like [Trema orientale]|uniref:E3 ubiquitin-protein ligase SIN-like n=1 Tax=Trema orientale TaxID=63057 RepID=A0A2P5API4_TREOI|nr:E3 ubiquitin-protein ligase SIN-like [Trema orientale]